jgi:hypothetical protein
MSPPSRILRHTSIPEADLPFRLTLPRTAWILVAIGNFGAPDRDTIDAQALAVVRDEAGEFKLKQSLIKSSHREPSA